MEIKGVKYLVILNDWERRSFPCPLVYYNQGGIKIQRLWHSVSTSNLLIKNITLLMFFCFILTLNERIMATFISSQYCASPWDEDERYFQSFCPFPFPLLTQNITTSPMKIFIALFRNIVGDHTCAMKAYWMTG